MIGYFRYCILLIAYGHLHFIKGFLPVKYITSYPFLNSFYKAPGISFLLWKYTSQIFLWEYSSVIHSFSETHLLGSKAKCIYVTIITPQWLLELT